MAIKRPMITPLACTLREIRQDKTNSLIVRLYGGSWILDTPLSRRRRCVNSRVLQWICNHM